MKRILSILFVAMATVTAWSQSSTKSPYSQYGFGTMADQSTGFNRGMNGLALGYRDGGQVNFKNPAAYSAIDSLSFIFDVGVSGQITNYDEEGKRQNVKSGNFEYVVAGFRAAKNFGVSLGLMPYSNIGYSYYNTNSVGDVNSTIYSNTYTGSGGTHQAYLGMGWQPFKGFSLGVNGSYFWGKINRSITNAYSDSYVNTLSKYYSADIANYTLDAGVQLSFNLSKKTKLNIGATYGYGHELDTDPDCKVVSRNSQTGVSDTTLLVVENGLKLPTTFGAGFLIDHENRIRVGADLSIQKWGEVAFPEYNVTNDRPGYAPKEGYFKDLKKVTVGGEYCKNPYSRGFFQRIRYKVGASYSTPYLIINGKDGPKEMSVSAGISLPITSAWNRNNNKSTLNVSGQWVRNSGDGLLTENMFRINIGLTFNERWFMKWKVE